MNKDQIKQEILDSSFRITNYYTYGKIDLIESERAKLNSLISEMLKK